MIANMDNSSKLFPCELCSRFTLLKNFNPRSRSAIYHLVYILLNTETICVAYQQSMRYSSEEKKQIKGHGDIKSIYY